MNIQNLVISVTVLALYDLHVCSNSYILYFHNQNKKKKIVELWLLVLYSEQELWSENNIFHLRKTPVGSSVGFTFHSFWAVENYCIFCL